MSLIYRNGIVLSQNEKVKDLDRSWPFDVIPARQGEFARTTHLTDIVANDDLEFYVRSSPQDKTQKHAQVQSMESP